MPTTRPLTTLLVGVLAGCASTPPPAAPMNVPDAEGDDLRAGRRVRIDVTREDDLSGVYVVSPEGVLTFPFCGALRVTGWSPDRLARALHACLAKGYLRRPEVRAQLEATPRVIQVVGGVERPGEVPYEAGLTVLEALRLAGGLNALASGDVRLLRGEEAYELSVEAMRSGTARDPRLQPRDRIFVREKVY